MSMAAGEYVSVSSQSDSERGDLARERKELSEHPEFELDELAEIYVKRGVDRDLARKVAQQMMAKDALGTHARDELGISEITTARPVQAALASAASFSIGAAMPLLMVIVSPAGALVPIVSAASLAFLALLGAGGKSSSGANVLRGTARAIFWSRGDGFYRRHREIVGHGYLRVAVGRAAKRLRRAGHGYSGDLNLTSFGRRRPIAEITKRKAIADLYSLTHISKVACEFNVRRSGPHILT